MYCGVGVGTGAAVDALPAENAVDDGTEVVVPGGVELNGSGGAVGTVLAALPVTIDDRPFSASIPGTSGGSVF